MQLSKLWAESKTWNSPALSSQPLGSAVWSQVQVEPLRLWQVRQAISLCALQLAPLSVPNRLSGSLAVFLELC